MPIEIRELVIKTEITTNMRNTGSGVNNKQLERFKKQLLDECRRMLSPATRRNMPKR